MLIREEPDRLDCAGEQYAVGRLLLEPLHAPCQPAPREGICGMFDELRRYRAQWSVLEERLMLVSLSGRPRIGDPVSLAALRLRAMLDALERGPVNADWVSGTVQCYRSQSRAYSRKTEYGVVYQHELWLDIDAGRVSWMEARDNTERLDRMGAEDLPAFLLLRNNER